MQVLEREVQEAIAEKDVEADIYEESEDEEEFEIEEDEEEKASFFLVFGALIALEIN